MACAFVLGRGTGGREGGAEGQGGAGEGEGCQGSSGGEDGGIQPRCRVLGRVFRPHQEAPLGERSAVERSGVERRTNNTCHCREVYSSPRIMHGRGLKTVDRRIPTMSLQWRGGTRWVLADVAGAMIR